MKKLLVAAALCSFSFGNAEAQKCAHDDILLSKLASNPTFAAKLEKYNNDINQKVLEYEQLIANTAQKTTAATAIPVVFHVILTPSQLHQIGGTEGAHKRAMLQLEALNRDFNGQNPDSTKMHAAFKSRFGKANLYFGPARRKPDGTGTAGVNLKVKDASFAGYGKQTDSMKHDADGGITAWDNSKYLNVWVVDINEPGLLGWGYSPTYASMLGIPEATGVVIDYLTFGQRKAPSVGGYHSGADSGRTLVHELGHFFNLWHIWGNTAVGSGICGDDDGVSDTPEQEDANHSCQYPTVVTNCNGNSGGEMYMNYMDYTGDKCQVMFTKGQVTRMLAQLEPGGPSHGLTQHPELLLWPTDIAEVEKTSAIDIFPNPTNDHFSISFSNAKTLKGISIINVMGQSIKQINTAEGLQDYTFDLSGMAPGVYTVLCRFEEGMVTRKIVLQ